MLESFLMDLAKLALDRRPSGVRLEMSVTINPGGSTAMTQVDAGKIKTTQGIPVTFPDTDDNGQAISYVFPVTATADKPGIEVVQDPGNQQTLQLYSDRTTTGSFFVTTRAKDAAGASIEGTVLLTVESGEVTVRSVTMLIGAPFDLPHA